ncbi:hypothetical protein CRG98_039884 [Punica granatum]|uniref:Uncharacterized protein n=1 Tax=Punica granatum TaxID=22663 RepID=A0A2I0I6T4_PUNGR|nr:hypothetical protein CRG98_039884 [Punica granatum]
MTTRKQSQRNGRAEERKLTVDGWAVGREKILAAQPCPALLWEFNLERAENDSILFLFGQAASKQARANCEFFLTRCVKFKLKLKLKNFNLQSKYAPFILETTPESWVADWGAPSTIGSKSLKDLKLHIFEKSAFGRGGGVPTGDPSPRPSSLAGFEPAVELGRGMGSLGIPSRTPKDMVGMGEPPPWTPTLD